MHILYLYPISLYALICLSISWGGSEGNLSQVDRLPICRRFDFPELHFDAFCLELGTNLDPWVNNSAHESKQCHAFVLQVHQLLDVACSRGSRGRFWPRAGLNTPCVRFQSQARGGSIHSG